MKYALALIVLFLGLGVGFALGRFTTPQSAAAPALAAVGSSEGAGERERRAYYELVAKFTRSGDVDSKLVTFVRAITAQLDAQSDIASALQAAKSNRLLFDLTEGGDAVLGTCTAWHFRCAPDASDWKTPNPSCVPGTPTKSLVWAEFTFADGWVYTRDYTNWHAGKGWWSAPGKPVSYALPEWYDRAVIWSGKAGNQ